jgi:hypothetical protein
LVFSNAFSLFQLRFRRLRPLGRELLQVRFAREATVLGCPPN